MRGHISAVFWHHRFWPLASSKEAIAVGLIWLALTVAFEFKLGRITGQMLRDYNPFKGRLWGLFVCWLTLVPYVFFQVSSNR
jgi:hypothetical protein